MTETSSGEPTPEGGPDDEAFEALAREALRSHDAPPSVYGQFARLAFEFRGLEVAETDADNTGVLSGVRSGADIASLVATHGDTSVIWWVEDAGLFGTVRPPQELDIELQLADGDRHQGRSDSYGAFGFEVAIAGCYRLKVGLDEDEPWASAWQR